MPEKMYYPATERDNWRDSERQRHDNAVKQEAIEMNTGILSCLIDQHAAGSSHQSLCTPPQNTDFVQTAPN